MTKLARTAPCTTAADYAAAVKDNCKCHVGLDRQAAGRANLDMRLRDANGLTSTLALVSKCFDEIVCLEAYQGKGLQLRAIDQAKSSFMDAFFPCTTTSGQSPVFSHFECIQPYIPMWLAPALLGRAIRTAIDARKRQGGGRAVVLRLTIQASDPDHLVLEAETAAGPGQRPTGVIKSTQQDITLMTPMSVASSCFVDGSSFEFTAEALFECPELVTEVLSDIKSSGCDEVTLTLGPASLTLSGKGGDNCSKLQVTLRGGIAGALGAMCLSAPRGPVSAIFKARHLLRLAHLCADSSHVLLQLGADTPLSASFELRGGGTCQMFIAPTIDEAEADNDDPRQGQGEGSPGEAGHGMEGCRAGRTVRTVLPPTGKGTACVGKRGRQDEEAWAGDGVVAAEGGEACGEVSAGARSAVPCSAGTDAGEGVGTGGAWDLGEHEAWE